ncbi:hypothetical protein [Bradyrhizobium elkanii]|uniref:hypothetical protein n=1 Tax=Bradyrhizobium elkanii TaxID=29448 RepID=UPI0004804701|nr:hypothetical protein [Bradyrhizobium elkanii]WLA84893.1 hypothetical protein QNJ99_11985 [Bradyrhizobium elkanii]
MRFCFFPSAISNDADFVARAELVHIGYLGDLSGLEFLDIILDRDLRVGLLTTRFQPDPEIPTSTLSSGLRISGNVM